MSFGYRKKQTDRLKVSIVTDRRNT